MAFLQVATLCALVALATGDVSTRSKWTGGFQGDVSITADRDYNGWTLVLEFNEDVEKVEVWDAKVIKGSPRKYWLGPKGGNANLKKGEVLKFTFVARHSSRNPSSATGHLEGASSGGGGGGGGGSGKPTGNTGGNNGGNGGETAETGTPGQNPCGGGYNYADVLAKSILFYEAQRSGKLPPHHRVKWRGDSAMGDKIPGGWYDAGDHVKFNLPMAWSTTTLAWGFIDYKKAYQKAGQYQWMLRSLETPMDYFVRCHTGATTVYAQIGDGHADHGYWGPPERMSMHRPAFAVGAGNPGSDVVGEMAASLAAGYIAFKSANPGKAQNYLKHAKEMYQFAANHKGKYHEQGRIPAAPFYVSSGYNDELCWAAAWLYRATNDQKYLSDAKKYFDGGTAWAFSWDAKHVGCQLLLYQLTKDGRYKAPVEAFLNSYQRGGGIHYTPKGLAWRNEWGALRYMGNAAFIALRAADNGIGGGKFRNWAKKQMGYALGDTGRSYVCGFGNNPPRQPHHRAASCNGGHCVPEGQPSPHVLYGALVGGPGKNDDYHDNRGDFVKNEVACDYNAGFQSALAGLINMCL